MAWRLDKLFLCSYILYSFETKLVFWLPIETKNFSVKTKVQLMKQSILGWFSLRASTYYSLYHVTDNFRSRTSAPSCYVTERKMSLSNNYFLTLGPYRWIWMITNQRPEFWNLNWFLRTGKGEIRPQRIYNSCYGNGVPAMFTS